MNIYDKNLIAIDFNHMNEKKYRKQKKINDSYITEFFWEEGVII